MRRILALCLLPLALGAAPRASGDTPLLIGTVGPGFTIDVTDASGKHVDVLTEGHYQLLVHDLADIHNFVLGSKTTGERLATTEVPFVGDQTFDITLAPDSTCTRARLTSRRCSAVSRSCPPRGRRRRREAVGEGVHQRRLDQRQERRRGLLQADRRRSFAHAELPPRRSGVEQRTSKKFTGSVTWRLDLEAGKYKFGSDPRLTGRLVVR